MMGLTREQEKKTFVALLAALVVLIAYRQFTVEEQRTAPLAYPPGTVAPSAVRSGRSADQSGGSDPLSVFIAKRQEKYPGTARDIFRMENFVPKPKTKPTPTVQIVTMPTPTVPVKTPEQIAEEKARAELLQFRFLGYLTDKDNTLFLSREGELFLVKAGDRLLDTYKVKESGKDAVILIDTATKVEVRIELSGGEAAQQDQPQKQPQPRQPQRR